MVHRYECIDILKGITILIIVYGHITPGAIPTFTDYASTFHIPLFFFVSGLLFNNTKYKNDIKAFLTNRTKGLILPFVIFSTVVTILYYFVSNNYIDFLHNLIINGWGGYALWFIPVLLLVELAYLLLNKTSILFRIIIIIICAICSFYSSKHFGYIPYNVLLTFCGLWFYGIGNMCRPILKYTTSLKILPIIGFGSMAFLLSLIYSPISDALPEWFINRIPSPIFYITPLFAIIGLFFLSLLLEKYCHIFVSKTLSICGKQSFIILAFHQIICMIAGQYFPSKITILIMIIVLSFLMWFIPKYIPWILGK